MKLPTRPFLWDLDLARIDRVREHLRRVAETHPNSEARLRAANLERSIRERAAAETFRRVRELTSSIANIQRATDEHTATLRGIARAIGHEVKVEWHAFVRRVRMNYTINREIRALGEDFPSARVVRS